jgi:hypothetical protein
MGKPVWDEGRPQWVGVDVAPVLQFLGTYETHPTITGLSMPLVRRYVALENEGGRLTNWTVAIRGLGQVDSVLGSTDWRCDGRPIHMVERTRLKRTDSLGVITSPGDEAIGLTEDERAKMQAKMAAGTGEDVAARFSRSPQSGLLLIYPVSRNSGSKVRAKSSRDRLYADSSDARARDLIAIALSFPDPSVQRRGEAYLEGSVGWRPT